MHVNVYLLNKYGTILASSSIDEFRKSGIHLAAINVRSPEDVGQIFFLADCRDRPADWNGCWTTDRSNKLLSVFDLSAADEYQ